MIFEWARKCNFFSIALLCQYVICLVYLYCFILHLWFVFFFQKQSKQRLLLRQYDTKSKMSWRQGLSHLLRRTKSSSNTNNNVSILRNKTSNGTTGNSVSKGNSVPKGNSVSKNKTPAVSDRETYYKKMDAKWTAPASPTHKCSKLDCLNLLYFL